MKAVRQGTESISAKKGKAFNFAQISKNCIKSSICIWGVPEVLGFLRCQVQGGKDGNEAGIGRS